MPSSIISNNIVQANLGIGAWDRCSAGRIWEEEMDARRIWGVKKFLSC